MDKVNSQKVIEKFLGLFPEYIDDYNEHLKDFGELLQHVFYSETINIPLVELLKNNVDVTLIKKYIGFIEYMWSEGDDTVRNVVDVTILENLSDYNDVWHSLDEYISSDFKEYINNEMLSENCAMSHVDRL
ncbi:MAG: hypothetical protein ILA13_09975 [Eubacterium sp.]|nr:hypothetical protein [Eubacterium sp.]